MKLAVLSLSLFIGFAANSFAGDVTRQQASFDSLEQETLRPPLIRPSGAPPLEGDPEFFRLQMYDFLEEAEQTLLRAYELPAFRAYLDMHATVGGQRIPAFEFARDKLSLLSAEELRPMMDPYGRSPQLLGTPQLLDKAITILTQESLRASCGDVYAERQKIEVRTAVRNGLTIGADGVAVVKAVTFLILDLYNAVSTTCETPVDVPTSSTQVGVVIADAVFDILVGGLRLAADEVGFSIVPPSLCIDSCVGHGFTDYHQPDTNSALVGKGCDNRDNDCAGGIDEPGEDRVAPVLHIDENVTSRCYSSESEARRVVELAVKGQDDCSEVSPNTSLTVIASACRGVLMADARDDANNFASVGPEFLTIDPEPPTFVRVPLASCYPSLAAARGAFSQTGVQDCTTVTRAIETVENACLAEMELQAVDECGNQSTLTESVRLDGTLPQVEIDAIFLPRVDGLACFATQSDAILTVAEATRYADNCTATTRLNVATRASGPQCDLIVESVAVDECGLVGVDDVQVRVDDTPPVVSCSIATNNLWPADDAMRDVGFTYSVSDNCDGTLLDVRFEVTSDEATSFGLKVKDTLGQFDPAPDAQLVRDASGGVSQLLLRAQRRPDSSADGRVYRVRVIATDSCGQESFADCFATVPHNMSTGSGLGFVYNSGQVFDATGVN
jgi:hypothetical protein